MFKIIFLIASVFVLKLNGNAVVVSNEEKSIEQNLIDTLSAKQVVDPTIICKPVPNSVKQEDEITSTTRCWWKTTPIPRTKTRPPNPKPRPPTTPKPVVISTGVLIAIPVVIAGMALIIGYGLILYPIITGRKLGALHSQII